jgi:hypothetical protein
MVNYPIATAIQKDSEINIPLTERKLSSGVRYKR